MNNKLQQALSHPLWKSHKPGDKYEMDGKGEWEIYYYPILGNGETQEIYEEPRALMIAPKMYGNTLGSDFREVPLRYVQRIFCN